MRGSASLVLTDIRIIRHLNVLRTMTQQSDGFDIGSDDGTSVTDISDIIKQEPMYYVLSQFLETPQNKNIAVLLEELIIEIRELRNEIKK